MITILPSSLIKLAGLRGSVVRHTYCDWSCLSLVLDMVDFKCHIIWTRLQSLAQSYPNIVHLLVGLMLDIPLAKYSQGRINLIVSLIKADKESMIETRFDE